MIKVLVIDDSLTVRKVLSTLIESYDGFSVVGTAVDPYDAREKIKELKPDVLTLDVEMPKMDGVTFLKHLMRLYPIPVVMVSTLTKEGANVTIEALALGAIDYIEKPVFQTKESWAQYGDALIEKLTVAAATPPTAWKKENKMETIQEKNPLEAISEAHLNNFVVAIGSSTGGVDALMRLMPLLPKQFPPVVIVQHIPKNFSRSFAERMNCVSQLKVQEAQDGMPLRAGNAYLAPGDTHLKVNRSTVQTPLMCHVYQGDRVSGHCPSVDVLFSSVCSVMKTKALGVLLTGMGSDGAQGLLSMQEAGASAFVQDEASSVVWGMPGRAYELGCREHVYALDKMAQAIITHVASQLTALRKR